MKFDFGAFITDTNQAKNADELLRSVERHLNEIGIDRFLLSLLNEHKMQGLPAHHGIAHSYPEDWMKFYVEKRYRQIDPVCIRCEALGAFSWTELMARGPHTRMARRMMREASDAGLINGIGIGVATGGRQRVGIGMSAMKGTTLHQDYLTLLNHIGIQFVLRFVDLTAKVKLAKPASILTLRQIEILNWLSIGASASTIAQKLNISESTVKYHMIGTYRALGVSKKSDAIIKAANAGLLGDMPIFDI